MKKHSLIACLKILSSVLLLVLPKTLVNSCGMMAFSEEFRFWLFQPDLANIRDLMPFTFSSDKYYFPYNGNDYWDRNTVWIDTAYFDVNVKEWLQEVKGNVPGNAIREILYGMSPSAYDSCLQHLNHTTNKFLEALGRSENQELQDYLNFAKTCEKLMYNPDPWGEAPMQEDLLVPTLLAGETTLKRSKSAFVRLRTAYQLLKLNAYTGNKIRCEELFKNNIRNAPKNSWVKGSSCFYLATAKTGPEKQYWLSRAFDESIDKRFRSVQLFENQSIESALKRAVNGHERAVIRLMKSLQFPGRALGPMREIYREDPKNRDLPLLISREINKLEDWLLTPSQTEYPASLAYWEDNFNKSRLKNWNSDFQYLHEVKDFIELVIRDRKQQDLNPFYLGAAYLSILKKDYKSSETWLEKISTENSQRPELLLQKKLFSIMASLGTEAKPGKSTQNDIVDFFNLLEKHKQQLTDGSTFGSQVALYVGNTFINKKLIAEGILMLSKTTRKYGDIPATWTSKNCYHKLHEVGEPADFDTFVSLINKPGKNAWETFLCSTPMQYDADYFGEFVEDTLTGKYNRINTYSIKGWDLNKIRDYKATYYVRRNRMDSALSVLQTIPEDYWIVLPYSQYLDCNPFYLNIWQPHITKQADSINYTKPAFVKKLLSLEKEAATQPDKAAKNYYLLGNAYFNMSWHGNYWMINKIWWSIYEFQSPEANTFNDQYYGLTKAKEYYLKALEKTTDPDLGALCTFMAGICENRYREYKWNCTHTNAKFTPGKNPWLPTLKQKFNNPESYARLGKECSTYIDFIDRFERW